MAGWVLAVREVPGEGAKEHSPISTHQQPLASASVVQSDVSYYTRVATLFETRSISIGRYHGSKHALENGLGGTWLAPSISSRYREESGFLSYTRTLSAHPVPLTRLMPKLYEDQKSRRTRWTG